MVAGTGSNVFINEFLYDNSGSGDTGEFLEIANPTGIDLTGWTLIHYNGNGGTVISTFNLSGSDLFLVVDGEPGGFQNGNDGFALIDPMGDVVQFLSYEGAFTATEGPANGETATDIGVSQTNSTAVGESLQLSGTGSLAEDFTWQSSAASTSGAANNGQTFSAAPDPAPSRIEVLTEGFETDGNGSRYTTSVAEFSDGAGDFFTRTDGSNIGSFYNVTGQEGSFFFAAMDIDGEVASPVQTLNFTGIDISGLADLLFEIDVAEDDDGTNEDWDISDNVIIEFQIDGGGFQNLLAFESIPDGDAFNAEPAQDRDFDGDGDAGFEVTDTFATFAAAIAGTGSLLDIRVTFNLDSGDEDLAIDNIVLSGAAAATTIFEEDFDDFRGAGFAPDPAAGQLDSDIFRVEGLSDGDGSFGGTFDSGDFARGVDTDGGVSTGGVYAFNTSAEPDDFNFGFQPAGSDVTPGALDILITNIGNATDTFDVAYDIEFFNNATRANSLNLQVSTDGGATFTPFSAFDFTTPEASDANGLTTEARSGTIQLGTTIGTGDTFILRFATDDVSGGGSRDEIGIDNIVVSTSAGGGGNPQPGELSIDDVDMFEGDAGTTDLEFTVTRTGGTSGAVSADFVVNFSGDADASDLGTPLTGTVMFADGEDTQTIVIPVTGDTDIEPDETFTVELSNPQGGVTIGDGVGIGTILNDDFPDTPQTVIINEVLFDPATGAAGDANGDGTRDAAEDEFIEIVNTGADPVDLSGWTLSDNDGGDFTFPSGTILASGQAAVLFGGGTPSGTFGGALVFTDDGSIGSGLSNSGDTIELRNAVGELVDSFAYRNDGDFEGGSDTSATRSPDLIGGFVDHDTVDNAGGALFSPGTQTDGSPFGDLALLTQINEIRISQPGGDDSSYIELFGLAGLDLTGKTLIAVSSEFEPGQVDFAFDLTNLTLDENGIGLIANDDIANDFPGIDIDDGDILGNFDFFGSPTTFLLVDGFTGEAGDDLDADNDGNFDAFIGTIIDSVTLVDGDDHVDTAYSDTVVGPDGNFPPAHVFRDDDFGPFEIGNFGDFLFDTPGELNSSLVLPAQPAAIFEIQGAGHTSDFDGDLVITTGIVTALAGNGFYMQDPEGDADAATSDGIFVFTGGTPGVMVGDEVQVEGTVGEFLPGNNQANLTITQIAGNPIITTLSVGNALPAATLIGPDGITPPTEVIEDDDFTSFDPLTDGIDFWESLEGMLVTVQNPVAIDTTSGNGDLWTLASDGEGDQVGSNISDTGLITVDGPSGGGLGVFNSGAGSDFNPERIQIDFNNGLNGLPDTTPAELDVGPGTVLNDVTGIVSYAFENYEVVVTQQASVAQESDNVPEQTTLVTGAVNELSVATYNVLNFDINPNDGDDDVGDGRLDQFAFDIGVALEAPDIVVLQEVQDDNGSAGGGVTSAQQTLEALADAIFAETGIQYSVLDNPFVVDGEVGGQPGGNIRVAFLYREDRVELDEASVFTVLDPDTGELDAAFNNSRAPLGANFTFNGETVTVIGNHFTSKGGSDRTFSANQPPANANAFTRAAQAAAVNATVDELLAANPNANIIVAGDFNEFQFEEPLEVLTGALDFDGSSVSAGSDVVLENLTFDLDAADRFSVIFEGNAQALDHILATSNIASTAQIDAVHLNTPLSDAASDHDPFLALFTIGEIPGEDIDGTAGSDDLVGTEGGDTISAGSGDDQVNGAGGDDAIEGGAGSDLLFGGEGDDTIEGGSGNDVLGGGDGMDTLSGGSGFDTFVIEAGKSAADADIITDFRFFDRIALSDADGRDIIIRQSGRDTEILADGVLVATLLNARASFVVDNIEYDGRPASIDAPSGFGRSFSRFDEPFDFAAFDAFTSGTDASMTTAEVASTPIPASRLFAASEDSGLAAEPVGLEPLEGRAESPWIMRDLMSDDVLL